jgi:dolichyl-phosphate beta-glucosyltransferase
VTAPSCIIVIPCYDEARRLRREAFHSFLAQGFSVRFLFVNDGSKDNTLEVLREMEALNPAHISILDKKVNGGKGEAIRDGMLAAIAMGCDVTGFWDADLATPLDAIPDLLAKLQDDPHLQMVFGSRISLLGRTIRRKPARHYAGRLFATFASITLSIPIYDTQCGAKIFRATPTLAEVLAQPFSSKWIFDVEIVARFIQCCGRPFCYHGIYEFPLMTWEDVQGSKLHSLDFLRAAAQLWTIHRRYLAHLKS